MLLVGLSAEVLARISEIVAPSGAHAHTTSIAKLRDDTAKFKPFIVLVDSYLYDFEPQAFEKLARTANVKLGVVSGIKDAESLVQRMLQARSASASSTMPRSNSTPPPPRRQDFETAKYDATTLHEALGRMGTKRPEFETAKYDAKTLSEALERMSTNRLEPQTSERTTPVPGTAAPDSSPSEIPANTVEYDAKTLEAMLDEIASKRDGAKTAMYDARDILTQLEREDEP